MMSQINDRHREVKTGRWWRSSSPNLLTLTLSLTLILTLKLLGGELLHQSQDAVRFSESEQ